MYFLFSSSINRVITSSLTSCNKVVLMLLPATKSYMALDLRNLPKMRSLSMIPICFVYSFN